MRLSFQEALTPISALAMFKALKPDPVKATQRDLGAILGTFEADCVVHRGEQIPADPGPYP